MSEASKFKRVEQAANGLIRIIFEVPDGVPMSIDLTPQNLQAMMQIIPTALVEHRARQLDERGVRKMFMVPAIAFQIGGVLDPNELTLSILGDAGLLYHFLMTRQQAALLISTLQNDLSRREQTPPETKQ